MTEPKRVAPRLVWKDKFPDNLRAANTRYYEAVLPPWRANGHVFTGRTIWITRRPYYCDRGRYLAQTDAPLDHQEGWPRYYFSLPAAKQEIQKWLDGRMEIRD